MFDLPAGAAFIINRLNEHGHQAYVVGGCVRDSLLGIAPKDWDICTSALPEEMQRIFRDQHVVETGLKHGTLTVVLEHVPYEVTTFRVDGEYTDHRHPDEVRFVQDVREDLARRDFTVNAMAYHPETGLVDAFGGQEDLAVGIIRCVGEAERRFDEDALRILRALRFASTYCFAIEEETAAAVHSLKETLADVAAERIRVEVAKLLCGKGAGDILRTYHDVIGQVIPQVKPMVGFEQHTPFHKYDVWEHTIRAVEAAPATEVLRLTMLLHDSGKPAAFTMDEKGVGHAYGHHKISAEIADEVLTALRVDNATHDRVRLLVECHDWPLSTERTLLKRRLHKFGEEALWQLIEVQRADAMGKGTVTEAEVEARMDGIRAALAELIASQPCVTLKDLAVRGGDLMAAGLKGKAIGVCLEHLLTEVMAERLENQRDTLLEAAAQWKMEEQG
ncbi:MAG: HD domain-containing protein [Clostridia bacterium]|nr:HD domain-containing protein [Clostridia bacterium]